MDSSPFSPKEFLKARRPERFSDTTLEEVSELDRSLLEFHLSSLTSRSQETDFERFARQLCEREICPNLLPQTGPTGGGDSKVDSETIPIADDLSLAWYTGIGREAASERWAFAFSAKADWRSKVKSDIAKIAGTKRGYTKAFFVTNQSVPDRKRAEVEDDLRSKFGLDVRILDRTWILDCVFKGRHENLAITELGVSALSRREVSKGPLDVRRKGDLEEVETRIKELLQAGHFGPSLVDDALHAADLARNLELPRAEIEGRYTRADQLAQKYGTRRQQVESAYQWGWTLFWWFEDFEAFIGQYTVTEERASGSRNAYDLEQLTALWNCLHGAVGSGAIEEQDASYNAHTVHLKAELEQLRTEKDRPSTALQAETLFLEVQLTRSLASGQPFDDVLRSLKNVILKSEGLVGYPLEPLVETLTEIGQILEESREYDNLFETILEVSSRRDGEVSAARLLLTRGEHQLRLRRPVEAISTLGRALGWLNKHETRHDIVKALYLCGCAYDEIGLPWAARGTLLAASSVATNELWRYGDITPYQAACYRRLKLVELQLGRLPHILAWHELDMTVRHNLVDQGYDAETLLANLPAFTGLMMRLLLRTEFSDLKAVERLPDTLDQLGLDLEADALLFSLGHKGRLEEVAEKLGEDPETFASRIRSLRSNIPLSDGPHLYHRRTATLQSQVLGCKITVESKTEQPCVEVSESLLAAIESFLATSAIERAIAREPELTVEVRISEFADALIEVSIEERAGRPHAIVKCRAVDPHDMPVEQQVEVREAVFKAVVTIIAHIVMFKDLKGDLETLFRDELVLERVVGFTSTFGTQGNVLGVSPRTRLSSWISEKANIYNLQREVPWKPEDSPEENGLSDSSGSPRLMQGVKPPSELIDTNLSHSKIATISLIRERLWNRAGWTGTVFLTYPFNKHPPVFGLVFRNHEAGIEIFRHWRKEFGKVDVEEKIRVAVVKGIDKAHPHAYRVTVGSNPSAFPKEKRFITFVNRVHRMDATTPENLNRFLSAHSAVGALQLTPALAPPDFDATKAPEVRMDLCIGVRHIHVRHAWEIGVYDIDSVAIHDDDDPVIPDDVKSAPVTDLLRRRAG